MIFRILRSPIIILLLVYLVIYFYKRQNTNIENRKPMNYEIIKLVGCLIGVIVFGFFGTFYIINFLAKYLNSETLGQAGWVFLIFTLPMGGGLGHLLTKKILSKFQTYNISENNFYVENQNKQTYSLFYLITGILIIVYIFNSISSKENIAELTYTQLKEHVKSKKIKAVVILEKQNLLKGLVINYNKEFVPFQTKIMKNDTELLNFLDSQEVNVRISDS